MRPTFKRFAAAHGLFASFALIAGCGQPSAKENNDPLVEVKGQVGAIGDRLKANEVRQAHLENLLTKASESIDGIKAQLAQVAADRESGTTERTALVVRMAGIEKAQAAIGSELRQTKTETRSAAAPIARAQARANRTKDFLLDSIERGYRKALIAGLGDEMKLRAMAQHKFFKTSVEKGEDPRLSIERLTSASADDMYVLRNFFPDFLPAE